MLEYLYYIERGLLGLVDKNMTPSMHEDGDQEEEEKAQHVVGQ